MRTAYFDHNVLDRMLKGAEASVVRFIEEHELTPVWSDENIREIAKSTGREAQFCDLLKRIGALRVYEEQDQFELTGGFRAESVDPTLRLDDLTDDGSDLVDQMSGFVEKAHGGRSDETFVDVLTAPLRTLQGEVNGIEPGSESERMEELQETMKAIPDLIAKLTRMGAELDEQENHGGVLTEQLAEHTGFGTVQLNNIEAPDVLRKIWNVIGPSLGAPSTSLEQFFGIEPLPIDNPPPVPQFPPGKVSAIYHQLNFVGYRRDSKMHRRRRFLASNSDMTHAGMACYSAAFLCNDEAMRLKAQAAYEFLGLPVTMVTVQGKAA